MTKKKSVQEEKTLERLFQIKLHMIVLSGMVTRLRNPKLAELFLIQTEQIMFILEEWGREEV